MDSSELPEKTVRIHRALTDTRALCFSVLFSLFLSWGCSTMPDNSFVPHEFPAGVYIQKKPAQPYRELGTVRSKVNFSSLDFSRSESALCKNYFNKALDILLDKAKKMGGDAVVDARSVVYLLDGKTEKRPRAECSDDGSRGQILAEGLAVKFTENTSDEKK